MLIWGEAKTGRESAPCRTEHVVEFLHVFTYIPTLCICIYMYTYSPCMCVYIYTYIYTHIYIDTNINIYTHCVRV